MLSRSSLFLFVFQSLVNNSFLHAPDTREFPPSLLYFFFSPPFSDKRSAFPKCFLSILFSFCLHNFLTTDKSYAFWCLLFRFYLLYCLYFCKNSSLPISDPFSHVQHGNEHVHLFVFFWLFFQLSPSCLSFPFPHYQVAIHFPRATPTCASWGSNATSRPYRDCCWAS